MSTREKVTIATLKARKKAGKKYSVITCYDHPTARMQEAAGIDCLLVGDTLGEVILGYDNNLRVKMDFIITLTEAVRRGAPNVFLMGDMPFLSYQVSIEEAIRNAGRFVSEAGCDTVKIEIDRRHLDVLAALTRANIPVTAHLGMRPQAVTQNGGYRAVGRSAGAGAELVRLARDAEQYGAHALLLEAVPADVARTITQNTCLPVTGICAGPDTDGQVLVMHDVLGISVGHTPRHVRPYADLTRVMTEAFTRYHNDVIEGRFPDPKNNIPMAEGQLEKFRKLVTGL
jgi:3-methyl-2-oxobutanoate hydroxymethyltransferase